MLNTLSKMREEQIQLESVENADRRLAEPRDFVVNAIADFDNGLTMGFTAGANWADDNPNWIRLIDEMPPIGVNVLTRVVKGDGSVVYQVDRRASYEWVNLCHYDKITHWMRIKFNEEAEL